MRAETPVNIVATTSVCFDEMLCGHIVHHHFRLSLAATRQPPEGQAARGHKLHARAH